MMVNWLFINFMSSIFKEVSISDNKLLDDHCTNFPFKTENLH
jgi:hypothetical protein